MRFEINPEKCVSCLACVRVCAAQAIAIDGPEVRIVDDACIRSGNCVAECPHSAIDAVGDLDRALALAEGGEAVLILAVESAAHFYPHTPEQVVNACYEAGFAAVHRGVLGDELVAGEYARLWADPHWGTMIRSTCPVVVERIRSDYPELVPYLAPVETPLAAEAEYHRALYGQDAKLVYAGVCLAESDDHVDAALTFDELDELLGVCGVDVARQPSHYERMPEVRERHVSAAGGLPLGLLEHEHQASRRFRKLRGLGGLGAVARAVGVDRMDLGFVDILPCEGCLAHPLMGPPEELFWRRSVVAETEPRRSPTPVADPRVSVRIERAFPFIRNGHKWSAAELEGVLATIGTAPDGSRWDCGACGFATCAEFAAGLLDGRTALRQCPPYQERRAEEAVRSAAVDELTGLATYRMLRSRLEQEVARSDRSGEEFWVIFVDLDEFKSINDIYGHDAGNRVLAGVGSELQRSVRKTDMAARYGGDEFVLILVRTDVDGAQRVAEAVRDSVEALGMTEGFGVGEIGASIGIACHDPKVEKMQDVLREADRAMYRAKALGGNVVVLAASEGTKGTNGDQERR
ncbi:MAG: diguanylate cyclase [Gemmatimonadales bacterium]